MPAIGGDPRIAGAGALALLAILLIGVAFWRLGVKEEELAARVAREAADSTRFATTINLINTLQARQDTIEQKIGVIREVDQRRFVWPHLLDEISSATPEYTWLAQISSIEAPAPAAPAAARPQARSRAGRGRGAAAADTAAPPPAPVRPVGPTFTLQGNAGSTQALTRFMKNLEASAFIRDVTLVTSEQVVEAGRTLHRFTLEAKYELPDSSAIQTIPIVTVN